MKKLLYISFAFISATSFAQVSNFSSSANGTGTSANATATVSAAIVAPITVRSTSGLDFGEIAGSSNGGTIEISTDGLRTGPEEMLMPTGTVRQAAFSVNAANGYVYSIALGGGQLTHIGGENGAATVMETAFTHDRTADKGGSYQGTGEEELINVGGRLTVKPNQNPGIYIGEVTMTVAYE